MSKRILLVEGKDDEHVIKHFCGSRKLGTLVKIHEHGGYAPLLDAIPPRLKESDVGALGIVIDADEDMRARWHSVRDRLSKAGYLNLPEQPSKDGTIIEAPEDTILPRVGVWLMPDNGTKGILEDFLKYLVPPNSKLYAYVEQSVKGIPDSERLFSKLKESKALIHTWLAWQDEPGKPLGLAITAKYLDPSTKDADSFSKWLRELFF